MSVDVVEGRGLQLHRRVEVVGRWLFGGCSCLFAEWLGLPYKSRSASTLATAVRAIESMDLRIFSEVYDSLREVPSSIGSRSFTILEK
jgi:hypothetical protein